MADEPRHRRYLSKLGRQFEQFWTFIILGVGPVLCMISTYLVDYGRGTVKNAGASPLPGTKVYP
jgi:hypothetical protein